MVVTAAIDDRYLPGDAPSEVVWQVLVDFGSYPDPLGDNRSRLRQFEHFSDVLVPFMRGVLRDTQAAFELANQAIKQRAERWLRGRASAVASGA